MVLIRHCSVCDDVRRFEQPPCPDGHHADCPEWICVECGTAFLIGDAPRPPVIVRAWAA
jgi:hypothetical protein